MAKMEVDDVVDLSLGSGRDPALTITPATVRDLRALTQNSGLTITPAPPPPPLLNHNNNNNNNTSAAAAVAIAATSSNSSSAAATSSSSSAALSLAANSNPSGASESATAPQDENKVQRRVLRPRTEPKSYAEAPDIVLLPARMNGRQQNGNIDSETDDEEMPPYVPIKELTPTELKERERGLRKLREDLRNEETKLVLLKKLKQSQHLMKENLVVTPTACVSPTNPLAALPAALTSKSSLSVTPTNAAPLPAHTSKGRGTIFVSNSSLNHRQAHLPQTSCSSTTSSSAGRSIASILLPPRSSLPGGATLTSGNAPLPSSSSSSHRSTSSIPSRSNLPNLTITPSVTITPTSAPPSGIKLRNVPGTINNSVSITPAPSLSQHHQTHQHNDLKNDRSTPREEIPTPAQRQAAAKLALRKQLEKTLLQIPPPKPPPPEMHFIPNPSNTEFVYWLGLETVVDFLMTKDKKSSNVAPPFRCAQCKIDFTPVWKWEKQGNKDPKVICEQCVTTNVKKALKAEHTNRLKQAFVKALQQEQEIEQRLATQNSPSPVDSHASSSSHSSTSQPPSSLSVQSASHAATTAALINLPPSVTVIPTKCHTPTPSITHRPTPPPSQPTPPPPPPSASRSSRGGGHAQPSSSTPTPSQMHQHLQQQQHQRNQHEREREREQHHQREREREQQQQHQHHQQQQQQHQQQQQQHQQQQQQQQHQQQQQQQQQQQHFEKYSTAALTAAAQLSALGGLPGINNLGGLGGLGNMGNLGQLSQLGNLAALTNLTNLGAATATAPNPAAAANLGALGNPSPAATAAAMQAFQQQVFRALGQGLAGNPQHMMQFTPLLYSYQMAMAQAAQVAAFNNNNKKNTANSSANSSKSPLPSLADIQRAVELQRQYLLEMVPPQAPGPSNSRQNNWKT